MRKLLLMLPILAACAGTPETHQQRVAEARAAFSVAHLLVEMYAARPNASPDLVVNLRLAEGVASVAIEAWAASPADDAKRQAVVTAMAAMQQYLAATDLGK